MADIVGIQANKVIRSSTQFAKGREGMERIYDVYSCRTQDLNTIIQTLKIGETHKSATSLFQDPDQAVEKYDKMLIEQVSSNKTDGGITEINVTYVGLFSDLSPKPLISIQLLDPENYLHIPYQFVVRFVEEIGEVNSSTEIAFINKYSIEPFPPLVNGSPLPVSPITPYSLPYDQASLLNTNSGYRFSTDWLRGAPTSYEVTENSIINGIPTPVTTTYYRILSYKGFVISSFSYERYGLFSDTILTISDGATLSGGLLAPVTLPRD